MVHVSTKVKEAQLYAAKSSRHCTVSFSNAYDVTVHVVSQSGQPEEAMTWPEEMTIKLTAVNRCRRDGDGFAGEWNIMT